MVTWYMQAQRGQQKPLEEAEQPRALQGGKQVHFQVQGSMVTLVNLDVQDELGPVSASQAGRGAGKRSALLSSMPGVAWVVTAPGGWGWGPREH